MAKIFCIGFGKTGTTSFGVAMERLGYRHCGFNSRLLEEYAIGNWNALNEVIEEFDSFDDFPWPLCYRRVAEHFPEAKFVLTLRVTPEVWYRSLVRHVERGVGTERNRLVAYGSTDPRGARDYHIQLYRRHFAEVQAFFANEPCRLLTVCWEDGDGWPELAQFLGREPPGGSFPHMNRHEGVMRKNVKRFLESLGRMFGGK